MCVGACERVSAFACCIKSPYIIRRINTHTCTNSHTHMRTEKFSDALTLCLSAAAHRRTQSHRHTHVEDDHGDVDDDDDGGNDGYFGALSITNTRSDDNGANNRGDGQQPQRRCSRHHTHNVCQSTKNPHIPPSSSCLLHLRLL